jgi:hypothetical protein
MIIGSTIVITHFLLAFVLFIITWPLCLLDKAWDYPIRYVNHDCVAARYLEQGVLMRVKYGNAFGLLWAAWCLTYVVGSFSLCKRFSWLEAQKPLIVATARTNNNVVSGQGTEEAKMEEAPKVEERTEEQEGKEKDEDATLCEDSASVKTNRTVVEV